MCSYNDDDGWVYNDDDQFNDYEDYISGDDDEAIERVLEDVVVDDEDDGPAPEGIELDDDPIAGVETEEEE